MKLLIYVKVLVGKLSTLCSDLNLLTKANTSKGGILIWLYNHDDVIKWKHFPRYWPFVRGIHRSPVNSPHKGQWRGALMFTLTCARINGWVNNRDAGDLRRYRAHYDVIVMQYCKKEVCRWMSCHLNACFAHIIQCCTKNARVYQWHHSMYTQNTVRQQIRHSKKILSGNMRSEMISNNLQWIKDTSRNKCDVGYHVFIFANYVNSYLRRCIFLHISQNTI